MFSNRESFSLPAEHKEQLLHIARQFVPLASNATVVPASGGFSGAGVWRVAASNGDYALRQWPVAGPEVARLRALHRLLRHIWDRGVREVAVPLNASNQATLIFDSAHLWQLEPWLPGKADFHADPKLERLKSAMLGLARWHLAARTFISNPGESAWFAVRTGPAVGLVERLAKLKSWQSGPAQEIERKLHHSSQFGIQHPILEKIFELTRWLIPGIIDLLDPLVLQNVAVQPCLRDVWHNHVLFQGDRVTGLIDPGACRTDHVAADLSRLLGSLVEDDRVAWRNALDYYQTLRPLTLQDWGLLQAYDQSNVLVSGLTWLEWLVLNGRSFLELGLVEQRLAMIFRRLNSLSAR